MLRTKSNPPLLNRPPPLRHTRQTPEGHHKTFRRQTSWTCQRQALALPALRLHKHRPCSRTGAIAGPLVSHPCSIEWIHSLKQLLRLRTTWPCRSSGKYPVDATIETPAPRRRFTARPAAETNWDGSRDEADRQQCCPLLAHMPSCKALNNQLTHCGFKLMSATCSNQALYYSYLRQRTLHHAR